VATTTPGETETSHPETKAVIAATKQAEVLAFMFIFFVS
jgi:hypothetical protein